MQRKTIIISDLHLGTPDAQPQKLLQFLEKNTCETLILNGDIVDERYIKYFGSRTSDYDLFFQQLKNICKQNNTTLHYIIGNHERIKKPKAVSFGKMEHELLYTSYGKTYLILHGDLFEKGMETLNAYSTTMFFIDEVIARLDRVLHTHYIISRTLKNIFQYISGGAKKMEKAAYEYAKRRKADAIISGHTHKPMIKMLGDVQYLNCGNRTETCSALVEDEKGNRKIV